MSTLPFDQFETAYEHLAKAIDDAGPDKERLFLAKLALALAHQLASVEQFDAAVAMALDDLPGDARPGHSAAVIGVP